MDYTVEVTINGSKEDVWKVITDIENSSKTISGIEQVEVLEKPADGLIGLKWMETRTLFGRTATEVMWITDAVENEMYKHELRVTALFTSQASLSQRRTVRPG